MRNHQIDTKNIHSSYLDVYVPTIRKGLSAAIVLVSPSAFHRAATISNRHNRTGIEKKGFEAIQTDGTVKNGVHCEVTVVKSGH